MHAWIWSTALHLPNRTTPHHTAHSAVDYLLHVMVQLKWELINTGNSNMLNDTQVMMHLNLQELAAKHIMKHWTRDVLPPEFLRYQTAWVSAVPEGRGSVEVFLKAAQHTVPAGFGYCSASRDLDVYAVAVEKLRDLKVMPEPIWQYLLYMALGLAWRQTVSNLGGSGC